MEPRQWGNLKPLYLNKKAQSILELAIFGSILIMLLGVLLNYGLKYNFQQKTMMSAFRKTLGVSYNPDLGGQASYTLIQDKHIPSPSNPFAVGSVAPSVSSASVIRSYRLHETAETVEELPRTTIQIQDQKFTYKTAGFRTESIRCGSLDKYKEIYGGTNVWGESCGEYQDGTDEEGNPIYVTPETTSINLIDSCEGEIINYEAAVRQCRMIVDEEVCKKECERGKQPGSETDCNGICSQTMNVPWYCANYAEVDPSTHKYTFPALDNIFNFAIAYNKPKAMGMQSDYNNQIVMNNSLRKQEADGVITTTDSINWSDTTDRTIVYINQEHNVQKEPVSTTVGENTCPICGWTGSKRELVDGHKCPKCGAEIPQL